VAHILESFEALNRLEGFVSTYGRSFYKRVIVDSNSAEKVILKKVDGGNIIEESWNNGGQDIVPFWSGKKIDWVIEN
jgi:dihydroorotase